MSVLCCAELRYVALNSSVLPYFTDMDLRIGRLSEFGLRDWWSWV